MRLSYDPETPGPKALALAKKIVAMVISSGVTYGQADAALTEAQRLLSEETRPVSAGTIPPGD